jgi:hypothetical protein
LVVVFLKMEIRLTISPQLSRTLDELSQVEKFMLAGGEAALAFLRKYHTDFIPRWRGSRYLGGGGEGSFGQRVVEGWQPPTSTGGTVELRNTFGLLGWKVSGGTIVPKTASALTIPLNSTARGVLARNYPARLFPVGNALCQQLGKSVQAVYALRKSVTQQPWPGAMPPQEEINLAFLKGVQTAIAEAT